ncbi:MAG: T9SS type A sorting domain-containing protein, partial [Bacteroidota bacterium]
SCTIESVRGKLWVADAGNNRVLRFTASGSLLSAEHETSAVTEFMLSQNYPNPLRSHTMFEYTVPRPSSILLEVYNMLGGKLHTVVDARMGEGTHRVDWTNNTLPSGVYTVILRAGGSTAFRLMSVLR